MKTLTQNTETTNSLKPQQAKAAYWRQHRALHKESGLSCKAYCQANNLNYHTLCYWYRKLKAIKSSPLIPVSIKPEAIIPAVLCSMNLKNGSILNIHNMDVLSALMRWIF